MDTPTAPTEALTGRGNLKRAGSTPTMGRGKKLLVGIILITHIIYIYYSKGYIFIFIIISCV